jgi:hypothetical protein
MPKRYSELQAVRLTCCDCGCTFEFSPGEQAYYQSKQLSVPRRCKPCRAERRRSIVPDQGVHHADR